MRLPFAPLLLAALSMSAARPLTIDVSLDEPLHSFDPQTAFGATIDAHGASESDQIFTRQNIDAMLSAGFKPLSYRLGTELAGEAWHWNPNGSWSDPSRHEGYWTSEATARGPIEVSYGYRLPRRGNTLDQAHNDGYSRIDDGDPQTFWKSNPYLDEHFAGENHPQWLLIDFSAPVEIDTIRIAWGEPHAVDFQVQWWRGEDPINEPAWGQWVTFPHGDVTESHGGTTDIRLSVGPIRARWVRVLMTRSSHTSDRGSADLRDRLGFSAREVFVGTTARNSFRDVLRHGRSRQTQSIIWVSSTDPWHRESDRNPETEQLGFDAVFSSGLTRGLGMLTPVALLYGTPEDAAAEMRYLHGRGYPISFVEMGEEPDGQNFSPEDYGALYRQWVRAIHAVDPVLRAGGPSFQSTIDIVAFWPDGQGRTSWIGRFISHLREHGQLGDFAFFSFEWYPFDDLCTAPQPQIVAAPSMLPPVLEQWKREGVPPDIPWMATEYGYSSYAGEAEVDLHGAIFNTEFLAQFLGSGGSAAYFYGYEPDVLQRELRCPTWGNLMLLLSDEQHRIRSRLPAFYAAQLLTHEWAMEKGEHAIHRATVGRSRSLVSAYAVHRPDGQWAILVLNKDAGREARVEVRFRRGGEPVSFRGEVTVVQYSGEQFAWKPSGSSGHPIRDLPPARTTARTPRAGFRLPPHSITVLRGTIW